jgi:hypothetical protein
MKTKSDFTEDWLPVKQILNGMIQLENGTYVSGVKVQPKNIFILDPEYQRMMVDNLRNFYNSIDYEFWMISADRPVDIHVYLSQLELLYRNATYPAVKKIIMQDMEKANEFMGPEFSVVDTEFFIMFQEKRLELVQKKLQNLITNLASCNLSSAQVSNSDLRMLLDNFLNGGNKTTFGSVMG